MNLQSGAVWALRLLWFLLPLTLGAAASDAIASAAHAVPQVFTAGLWVLWAAGIVASLVVVPVSLTVIRVLTVGAAAAALWAAVDTDFSTISILGAAHGLVLVGIALNQLIGDRFADGASYGDERRMLLRPPALFGYVLTPVVTAVVIAGVAAGPLLLANRSWVLGGVVTVVGFAAAAAGLRAIHQLAQRWIVFVPTGMVLHDLMALTEPVLFRRTAIERLGPAIAGTPARDLSGNAAGLMLECELTDPAPLGLRTPGDKDAAAKLTDVRRFTFSPTRPGALLEEADRRNIAVG